jgi:hypothetical protein
MWTLQPGLLTYVCSVWRPLPSRLLIWPPLPAGRIPYRWDTSLGSSLKAGMPASLDI